MYYKIRTVQLFGNLLSRLFFVIPFVQCIFVFLNTSFHCCICRHEVYLFAQFGKLLARIIFFGANVSVVNIRQKSYCRVARVFDEFIVRFVVYIQGVTVSYRFLSGNFQGIFNRPCFYYKTVQMELCRFLRPNFSMNCKDLRHADLVKGVL